MDNSQPTQGAYKSVKDKFSQRIRKVVQPFSAYYKRKKTEKENYQPTERFARQSANATIVIAVLTLITVIIGISEGIIYNRQLNVMRDQLKEMHDSGVDTHNLAIAASQQAAAAVQQAETMDKQLDVFKRQLDTMLYQQRPNIRLSVAPLPVLLGNDGKIAWNIIYVNSGLHEIVSANMIIQMSVDGEPFFQSWHNPNMSFPIGETTFSTALSEKTYTTDQFQSFVQSDLKIRIYIRIDYLDYIGTNVTVQRCWGFLKTGATANLSPANCVK